MDHRHETGSSGSRIYRTNQPALNVYDQKCGLGMAEENPGRSSFHRRISRRAIRCVISLALLFAHDGLGNGFIKVPSRSDDFLQSRIRIRSLAQDNCLESGS